MTDDFLIETIARRMEAECGWSKASGVVNHASWVDVVTHLYHEKGLRAALLTAYDEEIQAALRLAAMQAPEALESYADWPIDAATRGED